MEREAVDLEALQAEAAGFAESLSSRADRATLITLSGELGAGKTSFAQGLAAALGVTDHVTSPTFVLERVYPLSTAQSHGFSKLVHIDAYRLEGAESLKPLNVSELMQEPGTLILLEWPEIVQEQLPEADAHISFAVAGEGRTITYTYASS